MSKDTKHTEKTMQDTLRHFISSPKYRIENLYVFAWESDLLFLTPSGYWYEIEIKVSRSDFFNDAKKMVYGKPKAEVLSDPSRIAPNYFYYAVPEGMISMDEIPAHAGLIEVGVFCKTSKKAPRLRGKIEVNQALLAEKFYYNWLNEKGNHRRTIREIQDLKRYYSNTDETIKNEVGRAVNEERYNAIYAFKSMCPHINKITFSCEKEGRESSRCGWCSEIKMFEKKIYKEDLK